jgi:phospholipid transport system substrate-binding protein
VIRRSVGSGPMSVAAIAVAVVCAVTPGRAADPAAGNGPEGVVRKTVDEAFAVLKDKSLAGKQQRAQRIAALRRIADRTFDWSEIARSSIGSEWRTMSTQQRSRFVEVFKDILSAQYMDDIDRFQGTETVTVDGATPDGDETVVKTTLTTSSRERVPIDYRMRSQQGDWKVVDLSIEGVSLVNHFRKTFSSGLANMSVDQLIDRLKRQLPRQ